MKDKSQRKNGAKPALRDEDIREYAYHLYQQGGCSDGHDLDNWLEAEACLRNNITKENSHARLHRHLNGDVAVATPPETVGLGL